MRIKLEFILIFFLFAFNFLEARPHRRLLLSGSSTVAPLVAEIAKRFESLNPSIRVDVQTGGSSRGLADVRKGLVDLGMISRALRPSEGDLRGFALAMDGICLIVNKKNPVQTISHTQVIDIYRGKVTSWKAVGGLEAPITVVNKADGRSTLELFTDHFKLEPSEIKAHVVIGDNQQGLKVVAGNPNAIGYVSCGAAEFDGRQGATVKTLIFGAVSPRNQLLSGKFPLTRPLLLISRGEPDPLAKQFIEFARSREVYDLIEKQLFVPLVQ